MASHSKYIPPLLQDEQDLNAAGAGRILLQGLTVGAFAGFVIGLFRLLYTVSSRLLVDILHGSDMHAPFFVCAVLLVLPLLALISGFVVHREPLLSGSGIPQVELTLRGHLSMKNPLRLLIGKFFGTWLCLTGGLSVGREGPCIFMGASAGGCVARLWSGKGEAAPRFLIGGCVAGMTAAFGAPLAGLFFAFEEMRVIITVQRALFTASAAAAAWAVVEYVFDFGLVYGFARLEPFSLMQHLMLVPLGIGLGMLGAAYNAAMAGTFALWDRQRIFGVYSKALVPFMCVAGLLFVYPDVLVGLGPNLEALECGTLTFGALGILLAVKIVFSIISFTSGISGGLLMPMLTIGGITGAFASVWAVSQGLILPDQAGTVLTVSMGALFGATVRAPLTGAALALEMTGAWVSAPAMLLTVWLATFTANRLRSVPIYDAIKLRILRLKRKNRQ